MAVLISITLPTRFEFSLIAVANGQRYRARDLPIGIDRSRSRPSSIFWGEAGTVTYTFRSDRYRLPEVLWDTWPRVRTQIPEELE